MLSQNIIGESRPQPGFFRLSKGFKIFLVVIFICFLAFYYFAAFAHPGYHITLRCSDGSIQKDLFCSANYIKGFGFGGGVLPPETCNADYTRWCRGSYEVVNVVPSTSNSMAPWNALLMASITSLVGVAGFLVLVYFLKGVLLTLKIIF
ncbi:MAG: hypothetical protein AAB482_03680 [Patescibacteria group bacterium]